MRTISGHLRGPFHSCAPGVVWAFVLALASAAEAMAANPCALGGGLGGTGIDTAESGIGGTGIIGTISGFGSICVNGVEVNFAEETPVQFDGHPGTASELKLGHVVFVEASGTGARVAATRIRMRSEVRGPVATVDAQTGRIELLGQVVVTDRRTAYPEGADSLRKALEAIRPGDIIRVSGLRRPDGLVQASRIEPAPDRDDVGLSGWVTAVAPGKVSINGFPVSLRDPTLGAGLGEEQRVTLCGRLSPQGLLATELDIHPRVPFDGRLGLLDLEGYVEDVSDEGALRVWGQLIHLSEATRFVGGDPGQIASGHRIRVRARLAPGDQLQALLIELVPGVAGAEAPEGSGGA